MQPEHFSVKSPTRELASSRILTTPASTLWFKTGQHSLLDIFIRYNFKYRYYLLGQKWVVVVPTLLNTSNLPRFCWQPTLPRETTPQYRF